MVFSSPSAPDAAPGPDFNLPVELRLLDGKREKVPAEICRVSRGFFQLSSCVSLTPERKLEVLYDGCRLGAEVVYCNERQPGNFRLGVRLTYGSKGAVRSEPRIPVNLEAVVGIPGGDHLITAKVIDMSQSGLGLQLPVAIEVGTHVSVDFPYGVAFGEIRHCEQKALHFRAGLHIEEFMVRTGEKRTARPAERELGTRFRDSRIGVAGLSKGVWCFLAGHNFGWATDAAGRAVLRCSRCERALSAK